MIHLIEVSWLRELEMFVFFFPGKRNNLYDIKKFDQYIYINSYYTLNFSAFLTLNSPSVHPFSLSLSSLPEFDRINLIYIYIYFKNEEIETKIINVSN